MEFEDAQPKYKILSIIIKMPMSLPPTPKNIAMVGSLHSGRVGLPSASTRAKIMGTRKAGRRHRRGTKKARRGGGSTRRR